jgi:RNA recognition motif-containing protein
MHIHVSNLSHDVTKVDLQQAFEPFGQVTSATVTKEKVKGKFLVSGEVVMPHDAQAEYAIHALNGKNLKKRPLKIAHSTSRPSAGRHIGARRNPGDKQGGIKAGGGRF